MATYNGENYIKEQIDSILSQLGPDDELIVSDDSSTDSTPCIIESYSDKRIILLKNNKFGSPIYNLENALQKASGDIIFLADQDDVWVENKVEICCRFLKDYDLVVSDAVVVDSNGEEIYPSFSQLNGTRTCRFYNLLKNGYIGCCMAFNRSVLEKSLPFPPDIPMHDSWIGNVAAFKGAGVGFLEHKLVKYRRHSANASLSGGKSNRPFSKRIMERVSLVRNLLVR